MMSSLRRGHANLLCIVPIDYDPQPKLRAKKNAQKKVRNRSGQSAEFRSCFPRPISFRNVKSSQNGGGRPLFCLRRGIAHFLHISVSRRVSHVDLCRMYPNWLLFYQSMIWYCNRLSKRSAWMQTAARLEHFLGSSNCLKIESEEEHTRLLQLSPRASFPTFLSSQEKIGHVEVEFSMTHVPPTFKIYPE